MIDPVMAPIAHVDASIGPVKPPESVLSASAEAAPATADVFADVFREAVARVESYRYQADASIDRFLSGQDEELHHVAMATQQAEVAFELFLQTKNKVVQAYQEIMRMQL